MFILLLKEFQANSNLKIYRKMRACLVYFVGGATGNHHFKRFGFCDFAVHCMPFLTKQSVWTAQIRVVDCLKNRLFQASQIVKIAKASRGEIYVNMRV